MHQPDFIRLCLELGVLRFGEFKLKSGRLSPYFFNAGLFNTGRAIAGLGRYYARAAALSGIEFDMLFGPAYKGIPLVTTTAAALAEHESLNLPFAFRVTMRMAAQYKVHPCTNLTSFGSASSSVCCASASSSSSPGA